MAISSQHLCSDCQQWQNNLAQPTRRRCLKYATVMFHSWLPEPTSGWIYDVSSQFIAQWLLNWTWDHLGWWGENYNELKHTGRFEPWNAIMYYSLGSPLNFTLPELNDDRLPKRPFSVSVSFQTREPPEVKLHGHLTFKIQHQPWGPWHLGKSCRRGENLMKTFPQRFHPWWSYQSRQSTDDETAVKP